MAKSVRSHSPAHFTLSFSQILIGLCMLISLSACESSTDETNAQAQSCMDNATTGTQAASCMALVAGRVDAQAENIICSGLFLEWGFSTETFATLIQTVEKNPNNQNAALNILINLPLTGNNPITGTSAATDVLNISSACQSTGSPGLTMLSQFLVIATNVGTLSGVVFDGSQLDLATAKAALNSLTSNSAASVAIGQAASTIYATYCGADTTNTSVCSAINTAVNGNFTPGNIAVALGKLLQSQ